MNVYELFTDLLLTVCSDGSPSCILDLCEFDFAATNNSNLKIIIFMRTFVLMRCKCGYLIDFINGIDIFIDIRIYFFVLTVRILYEWVSFRRALMFPNNQNFIRLFGVSSVKILFQNQNGDSIKNCVVPFSIDFSYIRHDVPTKTSLSVF